MGKLFASSSRDALNSVLKWPFIANPVTNLVFYAGLEGEGGIDIVSKLKADGLMSPVKLEGDSPELGDFAIQFDEGIRSSPCQSAPVPQPKFHWLAMFVGPGNISPRSGLQKDLTKTFYWGIQAPEDEMWKTKGKPVRLDDWSVKWEIFAKVVI